MSKAPPSPSDRDRRKAIDADLRTAVDALIRSAKRRLIQHPQGHLARGGRRPAVDLTLRLPLSGSFDSQAVDELLGDAAQSLDHEIASLLAHRAAFLPGRVWCLRCSRADCEHSAPGGPREVFTGYGATGIPRFLDFAQWLLERHDPRVEQLYAGASPDRGLVTVLSSGRELTESLLDAYRTAESGPDVRLLGQVAAGWFPIRYQHGQGRELALSFQVVASTRPPQSDPQKARRGAAGRHQRLTLNIIGAGPGGAPLHDLEDRIEAPPWKSIAPWSQSVLDSIERAQERLGPDHLSARVEGVLTSMARRVEQERRGEERRTRHAEDRHQAGERPTRMALADLAQAKDEQILRDTLRGTFVVLGDRGRAHVFTSTGKLVTSLRSTPEATERKKARGRWALASATEVAALRGSGIAR